MEYYKYCSLQDLVLDDFFREWVLAPTPELNAKWHQFLSENPERWDVIQDASLIVKSIKVEEPSISDQEIRSLIQHTVNQDTAEKRSRYRRSFSGNKTIKNRLFPSDLVQVSRIIPSFIWPGLVGV